MNLLCIMASGTDGWVLAISLWILRTLPGTGLRFSRRGHGGEGTQCIAA